MSFRLTTVDNNGGKRAAFSFVHFCIINWFKLFDFVGSARWNFDFFVHTNATVKCPENLHVAPPWCLKSIPFRASSRYISKFDFAMVAQVPRVLWLFAYFARFLLVRPGHAEWALQHKCTEDFSRFLVDLWDRLWQIDQGDQESPKIYVFQTHYGR